MTMHLKQTHMFESETLALPPLHLVLGNASKPGKKIEQISPIPHSRITPGMENQVKRLIAHLEKLER